MAPIALDAYLHGPLRIVDALDAGLVKTVLEGMQFDARTKADGEGGNSPPLSDTFARILELVSLYMVYPFVRRRFTRSIVSIEESGLEDKLFHGTGKEYGSKFQTLWVKCKESAKTFGDSSDSATEFWSMCANVAVGLFTILSAPVTENSSSARESNSTGLLGDSHTNAPRLVGREYTVHFVCKGRVEKNIARSTSSLPRQ
ncbi:hypothetical protein Moror_1585 [Moniliophthora roreri MCA 2997]|uniref:Uncharacterized protein n=1 Tax=Moniliophthora roreri (strain MCA 2997) TaxID=1381753 RepID=V2YPG2_MONRO|nr:hypothetical protein Moror_1585 [Moniliophthora roreri MCA 2997]